MLCGSSFKNKGVQPLLDAVLDYLPSPLDVPPVMGIEPTKDGEGREAARPPTTTRRSRRWPSRWWPTRTSGSWLTSASTPARWRPGPKILNANTGRTERVGRILEMHANHREEREEIHAGDIVAAVGLKQTSTGDTLCDPTRRSCWRRSSSPSR